MVMVSDQGRIYENLIGRSCMGGQKDIEENEECTRFKDKS